MAVTTERRAKLQDVSEARRQRLARAENSVLRVPCSTAGCADCAKN